MKDIGSSAFLILIFMLFAMKYTLIAMVIAIPIIVIAILISMKRQ